MRRKSEQPFLPFDDAAPAARSEPGAAACGACAAAWQPSLFSRYESAGSIRWRRRSSSRRRSRSATRWSSGSPGNGHPWINLRVETVRTIAFRIAGPELAREGLRLLSRAQALALVEQACAEYLKPGAYFGELRDRPGFSRALSAHLRGDPRTPACPPRRCRRRPRRIPGAKELKGILARTKDLAAGRFIDSAAVLRRAPGPRRRSGRSASLVFDDADLTAVEREILEKVAGAKSRRLGSASPEGCSKSRRRHACSARAVKRTSSRGIPPRARAGVPFDLSRSCTPTPRPTPARRSSPASTASSAPSAVAIAATFTDPGQAALAFLDWIADGFEADVLRKSLASGAPTFERAEGRNSVRAWKRAVARALREAQIGWGARRHVAALDRRIVALEKPGEPGREADDAGERSSPSVPRGGPGGSPRRAPRRASPSALSSAPERRSGYMRPPGARARPPRASSANSPRRRPPDAAALAALEKLLGELEVLPATTLPPQDAAARLSDAVRALSIEADRARPGGIHIADYRAGDSRAARTPSSSASTRRGIRARTSRTPSPRRGTPADQLAPRAARAPPLSRPPPGNRPRAREVRRESGRRA